MVIISSVRPMVFAAALAAGACGAQAKQTTKNAEPAVVWHRLGSWSGHGNAQTESFTSDTGTLRIRWETTPEAAGDPASTGTFRASAHSAISGRLMQQVVDHTGAGNGVGFVQQDPHVFYVVVESSRVKWAFTVEEALAYP